MNIKDKQFHNLCSIACALVCACVFCVSVTCYTGNELVLVSAIIDYEDICGRI